MSTPNSFLESPIFHFFECQKTQKFSKTLKFAKIKKLWSHHHYSRRGLGFTTTWPSAKEAIFRGKIGIMLELLFSLDLRLWEVVVTYPGEFNPEPHHEYWCYDPNFFIFFERRCVLKFSVFWHSKKSIIGEKKFELVVRAWSPLEPPYRAKGGKWPFSLPLKMAVRDSRKKFKN